MAAGGRIVRFGTGSILGATLGGVIAYLFAPQSGTELTGRLRNRVIDARVAGQQAKVDKQRELIGRFRSTVEDPTALAAAEAKAIEALNLKLAEAAQSRAAVETIPSAE